MHENSLKIIQQVELLKSFIKGAIEGNQESPSLEALVTILDEVMGIGELCSIYSNDDKKNISLTTKAADEIIKQADHLLRIYEADQLRDKIVDLCMRWFAKGCAQGYLGR